MIEFLDKEIREYHESIRDTKSKCNEAMLTANELMENFYENDNVHDGDILCEVVELLKEINSDLRNLLQ